ncbi:MAG: DoxX family protein [Balneolaceae bacterium]
MSHPWHQYLFALLFILAGLNHFRQPKFYVRMMPPYFPAHKSLVILSGIAEILLGIFLLISTFQIIAAWGIILMLLLFFTVHIHMLMDERAGMNLPKYLLILRIPLQFLLIFWAWLYT